MSTNEDVVIYDAQGNPIQTGVDPNDPNLIGAESIVNSFVNLGRNRNLYPKYPNELFLAEEQFVAPFAVEIANFCEIDLIDELTYRKVVTGLKETKLFCVISLANVVLAEGMARWDSLILYARNFPIVKVDTVLHLASKTAGIKSVSVWDNTSGQYIIVGDQLGDRTKTMSRLVAYNVVTKFLSTKVFSVKSGLSEGEV